MTLRPKHFFVAAALLVAAAACAFVVGQMLGALLLPVCESFAFFDNTPRCRQPMQWLIAAGLSLVLAVGSLVAGVVLRCRGVRRR